MSSGSKDADTFLIRVEMLMAQVRCMELWTPRNLMPAYLSISVYLSPIHLHGVYVWLLLVCQYSTMSSLVFWVLRDRLLSANHIARCSTFSL